MDHLVPRIWVSGDCGTNTIYIFSRIRTNASAYLVLLLLNTVSQIMAVKTVTVVDKL